MELSLIEVGDIDTTSGVVAFFMEGNEVASLLAVF